MTLCNNLSRKRGVGVFSRVGVFSKDYGTYIGMIFEFYLVCKHIGASTCMTAVTVQ